MRLSDYDIGRVEFHLGMPPGSAIPAGDRARLLEAVNRIGSSYHYERTVGQIDRCDRAYAASEVMKEVGTEGQYAPSRMQSIFGDVNRTISISDPLSADTQHWEIYLRECDRLAEMLYVANYRREQVRRYGFERSGSEYVMALPGPADPSVATRVLCSIGGLGWR